MTRTTIALAVLLILLGAGAYAYALTTDNASPTALIPAFVGLPILALGLAAAKWPDKRKHLIHAALLLALIGLAGSARGVPSLPKLFTSPDDVERPVAVIVQSAMALACLLYLALAVRSFIAARKATPTGDTPTTDES
ncbi:MAG: hypothetical protein ACF8Q5_05685 [Phycisphaerales bacterium JB040]